MNDHPISPAADEGQLASEAAIWFARLRGPDAETFKPAFETWLARGALHLAAYNRAAEIFNMGKFLADEERQQDGLAAPGAMLLTDPAWARSLALVGAIILLFALGTWLALAHRAPAGETSIILSEGRGAREAPLQLASQLGEIRTVALSDGSHLTLDSDTLVSVSFSPSLRQLRLERGRARFEVAHERRPFIVAAGDGTVTARGTIFDISLSAAHNILVKLIRGRVDVDMPEGRGGASTSRRIVQLQPGDKVAYADVPLTALPALEAKDDRWTEAMADFDQTPLRDVMARANDVSPVKIRAADPSIGAIRISGSFKVNDGAELATRLALMFDLRADKNNAMEVVLRRP
jgi:transmembrane sensor